MGRSKAPSLPIKALSFCRPTELRGGKRTKFAGGPQGNRKFRETLSRGEVPRSGQGGSHYSSGARLACFPSPSRAVVKVLIYNVAEGAVPRQRSGTSYLPRAEPSTRPGGVSRSRTEPLAPRAKGPAAPSTLARESGRQPSGILESTAQVPTPTAPQAPEPSRPSGRVNLREYSFPRQSPSFYQSQHPVPLCGKDAFFFFQRCRELIHFPVPSISIRLQGIHGEIFIFIENGQVIFPAYFLHV